MVFPARARIGTQPKAAFVRTSLGMAWEWDAPCSGQPKSWHGVAALPRSMRYVFAS